MFGAYWGGYVSQKVKSHVSISNSCSITEDTDKPDALAQELVPQKYTKEREGMRKGEAESNGKKKEKEEEIVNEKEKEEASIKEVKN